MKELWQDWQAALEGKNRRKEAVDWQNFYRFFEDRFRGSEKDIYEKLSVRYRQRLENLAKSAVSARALDLGCGRGEFLELLRSCGFVALGIDPNAAMAKRCQDKGLNVEQQDAETFLLQQEAACFELVSAHHVVEHIPVENVLTLFRHAHRMLKPGGQLIIETPNAKSLFVASRQFYLDPTHQKPFHPDLLPLMAEFVGFSHAELLYFDPPQVPEKISFQKLCKPVPELRQAAQAFDAWVFGAQDVCLVATK